MNTWYHWNLSPFPRRFGAKEVFWKKVQDKGLGAPCVRGHTARVHILADGPHTTHSRSLIYCGSFREFQLELERVERELERVGVWEELEESYSGWRSVNGGWMESKLWRNISDSRRRLRELAWCCFGSHTGYDLLGADKPPPHILAKWTVSGVETSSVEVLTPRPTLGPGELYNQYQCTRSVAIF